LIASASDAPCVRIAVAFPHARGGYRYVGGAVINQEIVASLDESRRKHHSGKGIELLFDKIG